MIGREPTREGGTGLAAKLRAKMVEVQLRSRGIRDPRVLAAFERVPRHEFIDERDLARCYGDDPLPIGRGQTISQPYVVAFTLQTAVLESTDRVLEIGAGCGYQTALLAELAAEVKAMEYFVAFARAADARLRALGYSNVEVRAGDGGQGWPEGGTFDVIIGSAAAPRIPEALVAQLAPGGRLVMPVGADAAQELVLLTRQGGDFVFRPLLPVRFVPLLGPS